MVAASQFLPSPGGVSGRGGLLPDAAPPARSEATSIPPAPGAGAMTCRHQSLA